MHVQEEEGGSMPIRNADEAITPPLPAGATLISSDRASSVGRRALLRGGLSAGSLTLLPLLTSCSTPEPRIDTMLTPELEASLSAFADRILPADVNGPAASACGVIDYIDRVSGNLEPGRLAAAQCRHASFGCRCH